jgi:hypothetical protein
MLRKGRIPRPERGRSATPPSAGAPGGGPLMAAIIINSARYRLPPTRPHLPQRKAGANAVDIPLSGEGMEPRSAAEPNAIALDAPRDRR